MGRLCLEPVAAHVWDEVGELVEAQSYEKCLELVELSPALASRSAAEVQPLKSSRAAGGQLNLRRAQDAYDRSNSRRKLRRIGDGWLRRPLDQYCCGRVGRLDELDNKLIGLGNRTDCQQPI
jgi:hypothetical protein